MYTLDNINILRSVFAVMEDVTLVAWFTCNQHTIDCGIFKPRVNESFKVTCGIISFVASEKDIFSLPYIKRFQA